MRGGLQLAQSHFPEIKRKASPPVIWAIGGDASLVMSGGSL